MDIFITSSPSLSLCFRSHRFGEGPRHPATQQKQSILRSPSAPALPLHPWVGAASSPCCPQGCPPARTLPVRGCLETCVEPLRLRQTISSKDPLQRSCAKDVTAAGARRDLPKGASVEGMDTARGPGIHHRPGQSCHRYRQLKLPEGSEAVNVREARSRRNFIHCYILSVCTGRVAVSVSSLSCCHIT